MADKSATRYPDDMKEFSLKPIESQMLTTTQQQMTSIVTNLLSFYAIERLNYPVTQYTTYEISPDFKVVKIWENPPEPEATPDSPPSDTAKAIKGQ